MTRLSLFAAVLLALVAWTFSASLGGDFVYDDRLLIQRNPAIRSLANVFSFFGSAYWDFTDPEFADRIGYWRPLTAVALAIGHALDAGAPFGFRLVSLLTHAAATLAALLLARRLGLAPSAAFLAAGTFALHPVAVEAVAWPSAINDPLFGLFSLLALERWVAWREGGSQGPPLQAAAAILLALLSKETALFLLPALPLVDAIRQRDASLDEAPVDLRRPLVLGASLLALYFGARMAIFGEWTAGFFRTTTELGLGTARRQLLRVEILGDSLGTVLAPVDLQLFRPIDPYRSWFDFETAVELAAILVTVALGLIAWRKRSTAAALGVGLMVLPLLPLLTRLDSLGQFPVTDRYLYLPALGLGLVLASALEAGVRWTPARALSITALVAALSLASRARLPIWLDEERLFATGVEEAPRCAMPRWNYGRTLLERFGRQPVKDVELLNLAQEQFLAAQDVYLASLEGRERALVSSFDVLQANIGLAKCQLAIAPYEGFDDYDTPRTMLETLVERYPDSAEAWSALGETRFALEDYEGARKAFERAVTLDSTAAGAQRGVGVVYYHVGRFDAARDAFARVRELRTGDLDDLLWSARASIDGGRLDEGQAFVDRAIGLAPTSADAQVLAAIVDLRRRDPGAALQHADRALLHDAKSALAHNERGKALVALDQRDEALLAFRRACDFGPDLFEPHNNVASLLIERGALDQALPFLVVAYRQCPDPGLRTQMRGYLAEGVADDRAALLALAGVDAQRDELGVALAWGLRAIELAPEDVETLRTVAALRLRRGEPELALPLLREADRLAPDTFAILRELGRCLIAAERTDEARSVLERTLELLPPAERLPGGEETRVRLEGEVLNLLDQLPAGPVQGPTLEDEG